jgi:BirA family transcriptional regulator, biotin operon repressor / biotin---[acetyl-CoA-carboxylase] ligase
LPEPFGHNSIGKPFIELQSVDSTNNYARGLLHEGLAEHGTTIFAHEQIAGKGQRDKRWSTKKDANIILSIVVNTRQLQLSRQFQFSACISVAVHEFFAKYAGEDTRIKWPNDLYYQNRKAGGILIENIVIGNAVDQSLIKDSGQQSTINRQQNWPWSIVGIGININQTDFPLLLLNPVSLKEITNQQFDIISLAKELCACINNYFQQLIVEGFDNIYVQYLAHLYKKNETVRLKKGNRVFEAVIKNVSRSGQLIIQHGIEEEFEFGEVEWVIKKVK